MPNFHIAHRGEIQGADVVCDVSGRQYHIDLAPGELAEYVILVGEAKRADRASSLLTDIRVHRHNREYNTYTGKYKGIDVSIMSTGMGPGCTEIGLVEIFQVTKSPTLIRVGTCGALQAHIDLGDLVISNGAVRLEDTSTHFVHEGYPAVAHYEAIVALASAAEHEKVPYHIGLTATASGFYGAQGRKIPGIHLRNNHLPEDMAAMNVYNFEMEAATIFNLASMRGIRASAVCVAVANRPKGTFLENTLKTERETQSLVVGLEALLLLHKMDELKTKRDKKYWTPEKI